MKQSIRARILGHSESVEQRRSTDAQPEKKKKPPALERGVIANIKEMNLPLLKAR